MQVKSSIPRANMATTTNRRVPVPTNRSTSYRNRTKSRGPTASKVVPKVQKKPEPVVDTRTPEEVDRDYKAMCARFDAACEKFENTYKAKVNELREALGLPQSDNQEEIKTIALETLEIGSDKVMQGGVEI